jgi:hypothetical protein
MKQIAPLFCRKCLSLLFWLTTVSVSTSAATYYVSPAGSNDFSGISAVQPFQTVQYAVDHMHAGDKLLLLDGFYTGQLSLKSGITLTAKNPRRVIFSGAEPLTGRFQRHEGNIYKINISSEPKQLFYQNEPMTWAQWPNITWSENWIRQKKWVSSSRGSGPGLLRSDAFSEIKNLDLVGAYCFIRYSKGNSCYSRLIESYDGESLHWDDTDFYSVRYTGEDGRRGSPAAIAKGKSKEEVRAKFFLAGALDLLDSPGEWFAQNGVLYFYAPDGQLPDAQDILIKTNDYTINQEEPLENVVINGIDFFSTSVRVSNPKNNKILFRDVHFNYIGAELLFVDIPQGKASEKPIQADGTFMRFESCLFAGAQNSALTMSGAFNSVEDCVFLEGNRHGNFQSRAIRIFAKGPYKISRNTFFNNCGDAILIGYHEDYEDSVHSQISYNNLFNAGIYNSDVSGVYMPNLSQHWTEVHHNWVHNCHGNGVRLDQAGEQLIVHHNVFWASKRGLNIEGYGNFNIYNNTSALNSEADKLTRNVVPKRKGSNPDLVSHDTSFPPISDWYVVNNLVQKFTDAVGPSESGPFDAAKKNGTLHPERAKSKNLPITDRGFIQGNITGFSNNIFTNDNLEDLNLIPRDRCIENGIKSTPGLVAAGVTDLGTYRGAYSTQSDRWVPGSSWLPFGLEAPHTMAESEALASHYRMLSIVPKINVNHLSIGPLN